MILKAGEIIDGRYRLVATVGTGGFGQVWEAEDMRLSNKLVAIKFLAPQSFDPTEELADFLREVETLSRLDHPNIIPVTDYGQTGSLFFMAMPLVQGGSLADLMDKKGPLTIDHLTFCLEQICKGLQYAHDQQVVHSDIKPANFLMRYDGHLYLADFGIARQLRQGTGSVNLSRVFGSPQHVAPEQWANRLKPQSDIYSLGVSMFEMITGEPPLKDGATSLLQGEVPTPLRRLLPKAPTALEDLINRMLHPRPEYRYPQTAAQVWTEYQAALRAPSVIPRFNAGPPRPANPPTSGSFGNIPKPQPGTISNVVQQVWPVVSNYAAQKLDEFAKNQAANMPLNRSQIKERVRLIGSGVDLRGQNLSNLDLSGLDLRGASFYGASMANVNLTRAKLHGADFTAANLSGATLIKARLDGATLTNANLNGADLTKADLSRARLIRANLTRAYMFGVDLSGADLTEAILSEIYLAEYATNWRTKWPQGYRPPRSR